MARRSRTIKAAFLALGTGSQTIVGLVIAAVLSRLLTKDDYATYRQTILSYQFVAPVLGLGLPAAILYFVPRSPEKARSTIAGILLVTGLTSSVFAAFMLLGGAGILAKTFNNPGLVSTLKWFAFYPLVFLPVTIVTPVLVSQDKAPWVGGFSLGSGLIRLAGVLGPVVLIAREPVFAIQGLVVGVLASAIPAIILVFRVVPSGAARPERHHIGTLIKYALPLSVGTMIGTLNKNMDKVLVSIFTAPAVFAVFVNGAMEIPLIRVAGNSTAQVMMPEVTSMCRDGKFNEAIELFRRGTFKTAVLLTPLTGLLFVIAPELMVLLYGTQFAESASFFRVYLFLVPFKSVLFSMLFQAAGRTDLVFYRALINLVLNTLLTVFLILRFGPLGAAVGTLVSTIGVTMPYQLVTCSKLYRTRIRMLLPFGSMSRLALLVTGVSAVCCLVSAALPLSSSFLRCATLSTLFSVIMIPLLYHCYGGMFGLGRAKN